MAIQTDSRMTTRRMLVMGLAAMALLGAHLPTRLAAAQAGAAKPKEAGIYLMLENKLMQLEPSVYSGGKTGDILKSAVTYGIAKAKWKAVVRSAEANQRVSPTPTFYFLFEQTSSGLSYSGAGFGSFFQGASSPNEFVLAKFAVKKNSRELVVGEAGAFGAGTGVRDEDSMPFRTEKISAGYYKVTTRGALPSGEYCFFNPGTLAAAGASATGKVFDFGVDR